MPEEFRSPFPDYSVLDKWDTPSWNEQTREVVRKRLGEVPRRRFLEEAEWQTLEAVCDRLIPQPDREAPVPIVPFIDQKLVSDQGDGYRYENMPEMRRAWRLGIAGIEREARERHQKSFVELEPEQQDRILRAIQEGEVQGDLWEELPSKRFFDSTLLKTVVAVYYAHPAAWSEIGYGGPASPRGYVRLGTGQRDPWEAREAFNPAKPGGGGG